MYYLGRNKYLGYDIGTKTFILYTAIMTQKGFYSV